MSSNDAIKELMGFKTATEKKLNSFECMLNNINDRLNEVKSMIPTTFNELVKVFIRAEPEYFSRLSEKINPPDTVKNETHDILDFGSIFYKGFDSKTKKDEIDENDFNNAFQFSPPVRRGTMLSLKNLFNTLVHPEISTVTRITFPRAGSFCEYELHDLSSLFENCKNLESVSFPDTLRTSKSVSMKKMFKGCSNLKSVSLEFNTSSVKDMSCLFYGCQKIDKIYLGKKFNTSSVTDMSFMFCKCTNLSELDLSKHFDMGNTLNMSYMFACSGLTTLFLPSANISPENTDFMFCKCDKLKELTLSMMTNRVKSMRGMFECCESLRVIKEFNIVPGSLKDISFMFEGCKNLSYSVPDEVVNTTVNFNYKNRTQRVV